MTSPEDSIFCILSKSEVDQKSAEELQNILRRKHIVVHDQFEPTLRFDEQGLSTLGDLQKLVTIHGVYDFSVIF
jgi:ribosomal protein RSM22 (predicted rRNA methylase)